MTTHSPAKICSILIVDNHPIVRAGFARLIDSAPEFQIQAEASGMSEAIQIFRKEPVDLVIADMSLQDGCGLDLIREILVIREQTKILICSVYDDSLYAERALRAGAKGYINKHETADRLLQALREIQLGNLFLKQEVRDRLLCRSLGNREEGSLSPIESLSDRELQVFEMIGQGLSTRQIAEKLFLSPKTIDSYRENVKAKLSLQNSIALTQRAVHWVLENT